MRGRLEGKAAEEAGLDKFQGGQVGGLEQLLLRERDRGNQGDEGIEFEKAISSRPILQELIFSPQMCDK